RHRAPDDQQQESGWDQPGQVHFCFTRRTLRLKSSSMATFTFRDWLALSKVIVLLPSKSMPSKMTLSPSTRYVPSSFNPNIFDSTVLSPLRDSVQSENMLTVPSRTSSNSGSSREPG